MISSNEIIPKTIHGAYMPKLFFFFKMYLVLLKTYPSVTASETFVIEDLFLLPSETENFVSISNVRFFGLILTKVTMHKLQLYMPPLFSLNMKLRF